MILDYFEERYDESLKPIDWFRFMKQEGIDMIEKPYGFITYKLEGDAVIIYDMYVRPEFRGHTYAWLLHDMVIGHAKEANKRVAIGFSEFAGKNHMAGIKAMKVAGFKPAYKTNQDFVFIKGI